MTPEKARKTEKTAGYILLAVGLVLMILAAVIALATFVIGYQIPQFVPVPAGETEDFGKAFALFSNVCLVFFIFVIMVWAGSIVSSRGITMIKDVRLKLVRKSTDEALRVVEKKDS
jgi:CHASE3 domain sensor protein